MKEAKLEAIYKLFNSYTDEYGRFTLNPPDSPGYKRSENMGLWTGEGGILLKLNGDSMYRYSQNYFDSMEAVQVQAGDFDTNTVGLFSRHPRPFYLEKHHNVSKDEYRGFAYGSAALGHKEIMEDVIDYGKANSWFYVDDDPHGGFNRKKLGAFRLPGDRALYKIVAGQKPSILELLFLGTSAILNSRKEAGDTSSKIMSWFAFKVIEIIGFESKILDYCKKRFDRNMKICYNQEYPMEKVFEIYYQADHPFHELIKGIK